MKLVHNCVIKKKLSKQKCLKSLTIFDVYKYCIYKNYGGEKKDIVAILVQLARNYQDMCMKVSLKATALQKKICTVITLISFLSWGKICHLNVTSKIIPFSQN